MLLRAGQFIGEIARTLSSNMFAFSQVAHTSRVTVPMHTHEDAHFVLVVRGSYQTSARAVTPLAGQTRLVFNPPGTTHRDTFDSATGSFFTVSVRSQYQAWMSATMRQLEQPLAFGASSLTSIAVKMFEELSRRDALSPIVLEGLGLELFGRAAREVVSVRGGGPAWFGKAIALIRDRCREHLRIRDIASEVGVHPYHLARVCRHLTGRSPGELQRDYRVQEAAGLLVRTTRPIGDIALSCGYADQSQFTRSFRKVTGLSPGAYRRASR